ncbi:ABC transporter substrate-binding protein [Serratia sp. L9]|uniref:ABC transporter substrate-binding protein n=1 Tax=Serratia sp. L9 TaxID=3423946 RepID=UPI003D668BC1
MDFTRRRLLGYLLSSPVLSTLSFSALADSALIIPFGNVPTPRRTLRVLSAGAPADLLLLALAPEMLPGLSSFDLSVTGGDFLSPALKRLPRLGRLSGRASTLSLEKLLALNPDIIIDCGNADEYFRSLAQRTAVQTGIPYILVEGNLQDSARQLREVGQLLGVSERAEEQAKLAELFLQDARRFSQQDSKKPRFYSARGAVGLETGLQGSLHTEAAELLGLINVASEPQRHGLALVSFEQLLLWEPDIILTQDTKTYQHIIQDPMWHHLKAVRENQVLLFSGLPFGWLDSPPGVNRLLGLRKLQSHFDLRIQTRWAHDLQTFFKLFYHSDLTQAQLQPLLEGQ